ncbi:MAG: hypothetical protein ACUVV6_05280 [Thermoplasmatota archaeon]
MPCCRHCEKYEDCEDRSECCDMCPYFNGTECTLEEDQHWYSGEEEE